MFAFDVPFFLLLAATIFTGLLAGGSLDKALVELPARRRIGAIDFATFNRANDLGNGIIVYPLLGIGAAVLTVIPAVLTLIANYSLARGLPLYFSALLTLCHTFTTSRAAPTMLQLRNPISDEKILSDLFERFTKWHNLRAIIQVGNFLTLVWALVTFITVP